jgi:formylglycine-generating enzyme required for sulfatase activity
VSDFRLDSYEITVGRFRKFVAAFSQAMITQGAGKNPNNAADTGWDTAWNASLEMNSTSLAAALKCIAAPQQSYATWSDQAGGPALESLPINCLDWYDAEAFCIWDGGRLPTETEWNYAAAGGTQQRVYPWGSAAPDCTFANFKGAAGGTDYCAPGGHLNRVGAESPLGDGKFGHVDLAGNVAEWVQDWYVAPYPTPCTNCSNLNSSTARVIRGGSAGSEGSFLTASYRAVQDPSKRFYGEGARCARNP